MMFLGCYGLFSKFSQNNLQPGLNWYYVFTYSIFCIWQWLRGAVLSTVDSQHEGSGFELAGQLRPFCMEFTCAECACEWFSLFQPCGRLVICLYNQLSTKVILMSVSCNQCFSSNSVQIVHAYNNTVLYRSIEPYGIIFTENGTKVFQ